MSSYEFIIPGKPMPWERSRYRPSGKKGTRFFMGENTRRYQAHVRHMALMAGVRPIAGPVQMTIAIWFPDRRVRDDDNVEKSIRDALQANKKRQLPPIAFENDHQVRCMLRAVMEPDAENPRVLVKIREYSAFKPLWADQEAP